MRISFLLLLCNLTLVATAQKLQLKSYHLGVRAYEFRPVSSDPRHIAPLFKDPQGYEDLVSSISYNSIWGQGGLQWLKTLYLNAEWHKPQSESRFWKKHTLQAGLLVTNKVAEDAGSIGEEGMRYSPDTAFYRNVFTVRRYQQFLGGNAGLNRRFRVSNSIHLVAGLHLQGSFTLVHRYGLRFDSTTNNSRRGWQTTTTTLPDRQGKNLLQWQAGVPLGCEINLYNKQFFIRPELTLGIIGGKFRSNQHYLDECNALGVWLIFQPK